MSFLSLRPFSSNRLISLALATLLPACVAEQEPTLQGAVADVGSSANQAALDGGLLLPDAADASTAAPAAADETSELTTLAEFRGTVDVAAGTMRLTVLDGDAVTDAGLRRAQQGLCALTIVQDGVPGSGPANSMELVTGSTGLDADCEGYLASPLFCGAVTVRSFYASPQTQVFAQILTLAPSTGFSVQNGDLVPGASSGLGSWAYGNLGAAAAAPANAGVRNWVFARSGGNFTFTGRLVANVPELCDGLDNDCDGLTDEGNGCRTQGQSCAATVDCSGALVCTASVCSPAGCPSGEHVEAGACASDTRTCTLTGGAGEQVWNGTGWDLCVASSCDSAYAIVSGSCQLVVCGDGVRAGAEACDDGNFENGDGCSSACSLESGFICSGAPSFCQGICGDGIVAGAEACDDGNVENGDSCSATCQCGTGFHFEGGACISDTRSCLPPPPGIATGTQTWSGSSWGICLAATCATGYHLEGGACPRNPVAYVVNEYAVLVMDTITQLVTATIPVGSYPTQVAVNSSGTFAYVTNANSGSVSVIDTASNTVTSTIAVGVGASGIALSPTAATAFVASYLISKLSVINTETNQVTATIDVGASPNRVAVNPTGTLAYVADRMVGGVSVIDTATNTITANIAVGDPANSGFDYTPTADIAINSAGTLAYALVGATPFSYNDESPKIAVIDLATNTVIARVSVGGMSRANHGAIIVNRSGTLVYASIYESQTVSVFDTATNTVVADVAVGNLPTSVSMGSTDATLYVTSLANDSVSVIDTATNTVTATIPVGIRPVAIAVFTPPTPLANGTLCNRNAACDSGYCNTSPPGTANDLCATAICGNGVTEGSEGCDDGNTTGGDGCSSACSLESGFICSGAPGVCVCDLGYHLQGGACISSTRSCTIANGTGAETWSGSAWTVCLPAACDAGFHTTGTACEADIIACVVLTASITEGTQTWFGSAYGSCIATACASTYHVESGSCLADTRACTLPNASSATEQWTGALWGTCTATACDSGFSLLAGACVAVGCGNTVVESGEGCDDGNSSNTDACTNACQLAACGDTYLQGAEGCDDGNTLTEACTYGDFSCTVCSSSCASVSGAATYCGDGQLQATEVCDAGTMNGSGACSIGCVCATGYHLESGLCVGDTRACNLPNATTATETWSSGSASYGPCTVTTCASGYWVNAGTCALQSTLGAACTLNAACASGFCATGPDGTANDRCAPTDMNYIPAGTFTMGSPSGEVGRATDETQHSVTLSRSFFMGQTEVTQGQWKALSGGLNPSCFQSTNGTACTTSNANDSGPAEQVDWYSAVAFANARSAAEGLASCYTLTGCTDAAIGWKDGIHSGCTGATFAGLTCTGYRLPTESEWEYAARGGTTTATYGGDLSATSGCVTLSGTGGFAAGTAFGSLAWYNCNVASGTQAVGGKSANSFGLYDMLGNVWEWTGDWYGTYPATVTDPTGATTVSYRVLRGGSWGSVARNARAAYRNNGYAPGNRSYLLGFRLSRTATRGCAALPANATAGVEAANAAGWGACEATACSASYHVESGLCVGDTRSCSASNATTATETWSSGSASYGPCTVTTCASGYWLNAGACALPSALGTACTTSAECASGFCATGPDGTANDRCAPPDMNYVPAGTFTMGSPSGEVGRGTDETQHSVTLSRSFFIGQTEVTQGQWKALSGGTNPSCFQSTTGTGCTTSNANDSGPVENLDWYAAVAFANARSAAEGLTSCYTLTSCTDAAIGWKDGIHSGCTGATLSGLTCTGYRLPTESEWEYAARAGTTTATYGGNLSAATGCATLSGTGGFAAGTALGILAWYDCNAASRTQAVGGKTANSLGLFDMLGNVWEWTGDWYGTYPGTVTDPLGAATGSNRVIRGGSWYDPARYPRAAARNSVTPSTRIGNQGFRLARTAP